MRKMKIIFQVLAFAAPLVLVGFAVAGGWKAAWLVAVPIQLAGVLAERWFSSRRRAIPKTSTTKSLRDGVKAKMA